MAKVIISQYHKRQFGGAAGAYGNLTILAFALATNSTGGAIGADSTAALASGDVVDLGELPEGMRLDDASVVIATAMTASVTGSLGFAYADGVDSTEVPQDAAHFISAGSLATAARLRANTAKKPVVLPKPARLILTIGGANNAKASDLHITVLGELTGPR